MKLAYGIPLACPPPPELTRGDALARIGTETETVGFGACYLTDHPAPSEAWRRAGGHDAFDPFVALSFVAAATTRLQLLTHLVVAPYRNPFLLAKAATTLDLLSGGRFQLGLGAGYLRSEFYALGVRFEDRNRLFDEVLEVLGLAWSGEPVTYEGRTFSARDVVSQPRPSRRPPIWIGGNGPRARQRVVDHGDGWLPMMASPAAARSLRSTSIETLDELAEMIVDLRERAESAGRVEPIEVMYVLPPQVDDPVDLIEHLTGIGVTWCAINGAGATVDEVVADIERWAEHLDVDRHDPDAVEPSRAPGER